MAKNAESEKPSLGGETSSGKPSFGSLFVVATPIGNLEDLTLRALRTLKEADRIAAENCAHTHGLCRHYGIETKLTPYHQHNQKARAPLLVRDMRAGMNVALVTDAGTPGISDPGVYLIHLAVEAGIKVVPVPGPCAVVSALSVSGMNTEQFVFGGFLPAKTGKRRRQLEALGQETRTLVFFEAPHRIRAMLGDLKDFYGNRPMVLLREMTKVFEEILRGYPADVLDGLTAETCRGEFTVVVAGRGKETGAPLGDAVLSRIEALLLEQKLSIRDIAGLVSNEAGLSYRPVYKACLSIKGKLEKGKCAHIG